MPKRYTVGAGREFVYPADSQSLKIIQAAGGVSKITDEQRSALKFKTVKPGDDCTDMPEPARSIYVEREWITMTDIPSKASKVPTTTEVE